MRSGEATSSPELTPNAIETSFFATRFARHSYLDKRPIRVFRSSNVTSQFAPVNPIVHGYGHKTAVYRYDGLYSIVRMMNHNGMDTVRIPDPETPFVMPQHTFFMTRNPTEDDVKEWRMREGHLEDVPFRLGTIPVFPEHYNLRSAADMWNEIQDSRDLPSSSKTVLPRVDPTTDMKMRRAKSDNYCEVPVRPQKVRGCEKRSDEAPRIYNLHASNVTNTSSFTTNVACRRSW